MLALSYSRMPQTPRKGTFEHPAISRTLMTPFCHGVKGSEYPGKKFIDEYCSMPKKLIAFAITAVSNLHICTDFARPLAYLQVENALDEYATGHCVNIQLSQKDYQQRYIGHLQALEAWATKNPSGWEALSKKYGDQAVYFFVPSIVPRMLISC